MKQPDKPEVGGPRKHIKKEKSGWLQVFHSSKCIKPNRGASADLGEKQVATQSGPSRVRHTPCESSSSIRKKVTQQHNPGDRGMNGNQDRSEKTLSYFSTPLSQSFFKSPIYLNTTFPVKECFSKVCLPGGRSALTVTLSQRQRLLNVDWTKDAVFSLQQKLLKLPEKEAQCGVYPCLQMFSQCPFRGSCSYKQHRGNYIHYCKEQMCKLVVSWGKIIPSPLSRNVHSAMQLEHFVRRSL